VITVMQFSRIIRVIRVIRIIRVTRAVMVIWIIRVIGNPAPQSLLAFAFLCFISPRHDFWPVIAV
jgi:hypothetical protein